MRAAVLKGVNRFDICELPRPVPNEHEVLIKVRAAGICQSDIHWMQRQWQYEHPLVMGHVFAGTVEEVGRKAERATLGDRVTAVPFLPCQNCVYCCSGKSHWCEHHAMIGFQRPGGFAEYVTVPEENLLPIGEQISFEEAIMLEPLAVAAHSVMELNIQPEDTVAVFGLGIRGLLSMQWLQLTGVKRIIGIDIDEDRLLRSKHYGVTDTIHSLKESPEKKIDEWTNGLGTDVTLECAGSTVTQEQCLRVTKRGGQIGYQVRVHADRVLSREEQETIFRREYLMKALGQPYSEPFPGKEWVSSIHFLEERQLKVKPFISYRFRLEEIQSAIDLALLQEEECSRIVLLNDQ
ncbi:galactitol-1-phosphate 5-dehydrogenase [Enterococcus florum]|uniref:Galactitol-1-phosphate 5-dehydrogenase n=1 Tax=Enterococcus florum TaxID=2480627 RepID=A0A4P5P9I9_9ENTE|nr:galactitol-1-phosphate 5-dehydrogenase [Enterococcus florum]GCF94236.1 galactitol-1-phosphate 5-dehydrogenase [Enterococcus florum]